jgi:hypothetical protein
MIPIIAAVTEPNGCIGIGCKPHSNLMGVGVAGNRLYVAGGLGSALNVGKSVEVLDPAVDKWTWKPGKAMSASRSAFGVGVAGARLFAVGGLVKSSGLLPKTDFTPTVEVLNTSSGAWSAGPNMSAPRAYFGVGVIGDALYAVGGVGSDGAYLRSMEVLDLKTLTWRAGPNMSEARGYVGVAAADGRLHAVGGYNDAAPTHDGRFLRSMEVRRETPCGCEPRDRPPLSARRSSTPAAARGRPGRR